MERNDQQKSNGSGSPSLLEQTPSVTLQRDVSPNPTVITGQRVQVIEPYGSTDNTVNRTIAHGTSGEDAFRDLQIHHPNANRKAVRTSDAGLTDRPSQMIEGQLEAVRTRGDRNGIPLVQKDLILTDEKGYRSIMIPNPVAGFVEINKNAWNSVSLWSQPAGHPERELLGQVLHGERGSSPYKTGDYVQYGAPLIRQSNAGTAAVHTHIELEPDQFRKYLGDMLNDRLTLSQDTAYRNPSTRSAMADGMLTRTERGGEVRAMQEKLAGLGYRGQDGKPLASTGYFGDDTFAAVQAFQRANGLKDDGKAGSKTLAALDAATEAKPQHAAGPDMRDASSADNARFQQAMEKLQDMEKQRAHAGLQPLFADNHQVERTAGQLVLASKTAGMDRIDSVVARLDGTGVFAVQGAMNDPASRRVAVEYEQAIAQSVEASSRQSEQVNSQRHDQQDAQEHSRARGM